MVRVNTVELPGGDAAVLRVKETGAGLALCCDCNGRYTYLDPYVGTQVAPVSYTHLTLPTKRIV